jgi:metallo-beta-lactamase class B
MNRETSMKPRRAAAAAVVLLAGGCAHPPPASEQSVAAHVAEAHRLAGDDLKPLLALCKPAPAARPGQEVIDKLLVTMMARPAPAPAKVFDNLYFVGANWVSAWAISTSQGVILIDALNNADEARRLIDEGMRKVGLDPASIRFVIVTHAHGDHYGGLDYLEPRYKPKVVMSEADWRQAEGQLEYDSKHWGRPPKFEPARDRRIHDGDKLVLGDTSVTVYVTPGHTHGTISPVFEVAQGGQRHKVLLWGGTAFNFGKDVPRLQGYIDAADRMADIAAKQGIDVMISNHSGYDDSLRKMDELRRGAAPHPFVIGNDAVVRGLKAMESCARAQRDRFLMG